MPSRKFEFLVEWSEDDAPDGQITVVDVETQKKIKVPCPPIDRRQVLGRETAFAFMFRSAMINMFRRCFPEYVDSTGDMPGTQLIVPE